MKKRTWGYSFIIAVISVLLTACSASPSTSEGTSIDQAGLTEGANGDHEETSSDLHQLHWSYTGDTAPEHWGALDPSFGACEQGKEQSPINLEEAKAISSEANINVHYQSSPFSILNNGHTIQADATNDENSIEIDGEEYKLVQFHFHTPSEHELEGKNLDMELHFVHMNDNGQLGVLGVLMMAGEENEELAKIWSKLPAEETKDNIPLDEPIDLNLLLPESKEGFHYNGSLTTPPCSEGVKWVVLSEPISVSQEQIDAFATIFPDNHRPVQPWNDREVYEVIVE